MENIKFLIFFKIFISSFLIWICQYYNGVSICSSSIEKKYSIDGNSCLTVNRLLSGSSLVVKSTGDTSSDVGNTKLMDERKDIYEYIKGTKPGKKKVKEILLKSKGRNRLPKRKQNILNRMDTVFEEKIFNYLGTIHIIKDNLEVIKRTERKMVNRKLDLGISSPYLIFLIGLALFIILVAVVSNYATGDIRPIIENALNVVQQILLVVLTFLMALIILCIIYVSIKTAKYEKIKAKNCKICYNIVKSFDKKCI
ncbi:Plasmodium exported protein, unknown function [Plasmodium malariae]|uniref:Variable surface protein n=1 Tax=Plasmodium malariae TaxID=5858 RepID=A0A1D3JGP4_PLAMA|nr:Plasmodium exported protein, unknown function [Plasmodium malariae]SBT85452.1 Plasmodium exported protein, unknown function [Plasmodium malariae]